MDARPKPTLLLLSDGRGDTGQRVLQAALVQFADEEHELLRRANVRSVDEVWEAIDEVADREAVVFYTLVSEETRQAVRAAAEQHLLPAVDLLGPTLTALHDVFHRDPRAEPGLLYESDREAIDRAEAIDYVLKHDDGRLAHELDRADVVLVGVSRASKSSTCFYLGYQGIRAANVPLFPDIPPPRELLELPAERVIGLKSNVMRLQGIRRARAQALHRPPLDPYLDKQEIARELRYAHALMQHHGWKSVDVSYRAVEEIAKEVVRLMPSRRR